MSFLQQLIQLLSESPGSVIYHLITLLAMQAVLGIALWQWRRDPADDFARRLCAAAAVILFSRLLMMFAVLLSNSNALSPAAVLPPLEQATNAVTVILLVWALAPHMPSLPRLGDVVLVILLLFTGAMYAFFAQNWIDRVANGLTNGGYNSSQQAAVWSIFQLVILGIGLLLLLAGRPRDWWLRCFTLTILFVAYLAHFWSHPNIVTTSTDIAYWVRLGNLIAFPLLAVMAYRHNLAELLAAQMASRPPAEQLAEYLNLSRRLIGSVDINRTLHEAVEMVTDVVTADLVALATVTLDDPNHLRLTSSQFGPKNQPHSWGLSLTDWPSFRLAMQQRQSVELVPNGLGARQLHDLYRELGAGDLGALLIEPLLITGAEVGVLLLAAPNGRERWPADDKALTPFIAAYIAQAIYNAQLYERALRDSSSIAAAGSTAVAAPTAVTARLITLETERDKALAEVEILANRLEQTQLSLVGEQERTREMAAHLAGLELSMPDEKVTSLENEVDALREALLEAEEAMALASAGEGGLSPEWVMLTLTRYSGQLEEAQTRIQTLEQAWTRREANQNNEVITSLVQELRTPLTSIGAYVDLILSETMGILGAKQLSVLRRVQANVNHMETLLEQIIQLAAAPEQSLLASSEPIDVRELIETAVTYELLQANIPQFREKGLRLTLNLADDLPLVPINRNTLYQIFLHLIRHACYVAPGNGRITIAARLDTIQESRADGELETFGFLHLDIIESEGDTNPPEAFQILEGIGNGHRLAQNQPQPDPNDLTAARTLVTSHGGRIWVDNQSSAGRTLSVLLPISHPNVKASAKPNAKPSVKPNALPLSAKTTTRPEIGHD